MFGDMLMLKCSREHGLYLMEIPDPEGLRYRGVELAGPVDEVVAALRAAGVELVADDAGWSFAGGEVALYAPGDSVEAVTLIDRRYTFGALVALPPGELAVADPVTRYRVTGDGLGAVRFGESRAEVRRRMGGGNSFEIPPGSILADEDSFYAEGLSVRYGPDGQVRRILVSRADEVLLDGVNLQPRERTPLRAIGDALVAAGHRISYGEATLHVEGAGVELRSLRPGADMPAAGLVLSPAE